MSSNGDRVTVVSMVCHQAPGQEPSQFSARSDWRVPEEASDQPYSRTVRVGTEWQELALGWVRNVGVVIIKHDPPARQLLPTEEERAADDGNLLEVSLLPEMDGCPLLVRPRDWLRFSPARLPGPVRVRFRLRPGPVRVIALAGDNSLLPSTRSERAELLPADGG